ncbi:MAG: acetate--CoA ligase family protein [Candidatus Krumholzibacteriia bacterium]
MNPALDSNMDRVRAKLLKALDERRNSLHEHEIYEILGLAGFRVPRTRFVTNEKEIDALDTADMPGGEVVCKLISPGMPHRTEFGGIKFIPNNPKELAAVFREFARIAVKTRVPFSGMMVAEKVPGRDSIPFQLLLSLRQDPSFGPVVFCGLGGVGTEVYKRSLTREKGLFIRAASDIGDREGTERALDATFFYPVIAGKTRVAKEPIVDTAKLRAALAAFAKLGEVFSPLAADSPVTIEEIEINPLQITNDGELVPLDALMRISGAKHDLAVPPQAGIVKLLEPKSALIIGASANKMNMGRIILRNLIKGGGVPKERIYLLHPEASEIDGCRAFKSIAELPEKADMTVFTIPADEKAAVLLSELIEGEKTASITLISGGFGETERGRDLDRRLRDSIRKARSRQGGGVVVNGPNCMGIVSKPGGYNTFFLPEYKLPFRGTFGERCAIVSQSGAYLVTLISNLDRALNPKYMITFGNQADAGVTDYLLALKDDRDIDLFVLYFEGLKPYDGERFLAVIREIIRKGKSVILYKAGKTEAGATAVASHTASMAGNFEVMHRLLRDAGVIMPDTLDEVEDTIKVFTLLEGRRVRGSRVGIFSNAGFECSVAADTLGALTLATFSDDTVRKLREALPTDIIDVHNPVDATPSTHATNYGKCIEAMLADENVDCLMAANVAPTPFMENLPAGADHKEDILHENSYPNVTIRAFKATTKPMVASLNSGRLFDPAVQMMEDAGIPCFRKIDRAMKALGFFIEHGKRET